MKSYFRLRARLVPYLYTAQRAAYLSGVVPVRGLYIDFPDPASGAFSEPGLHQYSFGPSMWVAPVSAPADKGAAGLAAVSIWFPPGPWFEWGSWQVHNGGEGGGGAVYPRTFALEETPVFSRPGAIIPLSGALEGEGEQGSSSGSAVGSAVGVPSAITFYVVRGWEGGRGGSALPARSPAPTGGGSALPAPLPLPPRPPPSTLP